MEEKDARRERWERKTNHRRKEHDRYEKKHRKEGIDWDDNCPTEQEYMESANDSDNSNQ